MVQSKSNRRWSRSHWQVLAIVITLAVWLLILPAQAKAISSTTGITVSPGQLNFSLSKDAPTQVVQLTLTNGYDSPVTLNAEFKGIDENAGLLVPTDDLEPSFAAALHISETAISLAPRATRTVQVQVDNVDTLGPGGHYATLVLTQQDAGGHQVSLKAAISLSLFAIKVAGAHPQLNLTSFHSNGWLFHLPSRASLTFHNSGNVHVVPRAVVNVLGKQQHLLAHGIANQQSIPLLPAESDTALVSIAAVSHAWRPQRLQLQVAYRADGGLQPQVISYSRWYIPAFYPLILLPAALGLGLTRRRWQPHLKPRTRVVQLNRWRKTLAKIITARLQSRGDHIPVRVIPATLKANEASQLPVNTKPPKLPTPSKTVSKASSKAAPKQSKSKPITAVTKPKKPKTIKPVEPETPLITLASLQRRTTKVTPSATAKRRSSAKKSGATKKSSVTKKAVAKKPGNR